MKQVAELAVQLRKAAPQCRLASFSGGDKHNAIPREASAVVYVPADSCAASEGTVAGVVKDMERSFAPVEPDMKVDVVFGEVRFTGEF